MYIFEGLQVRNLSGQSRQIGKKVHNVMYMCILRITSVRSVGRLQTIIIFFIGFVFHFIFWFRLVCIIALLHFIFRTKFFFSTQTFQTALNFLKLGFWSRVMLLQD